MSKKTSYLLGILLTIIVGTFLYWKICCCNCKGNDKENKQKVESNIVVPESKKATKFPFNIKDPNGNLSLKVDDNFNFKKSNFVILDSVSENVNNGILKVKEYLDAEGNKRFNITGYYSTDETNDSAFPNLGLARANSVKNYMISKGISSKVINTYGTLNDDLVPGENDILYGPVGFDIQTKANDSSEEDKALEAACNAIKENPLVLHFNSGSASINLTAEQREKIAAISKCVDKLGVRVQLEGHTDSSGDANRNIVLGQNRADFAKSYFIKNGILSSNIDTSSKGEAEPVADNATKEGQAENRRTVVTIK